MFICFLQTKTLQTIWMIESDVSILCCIGSGGNVRVCHAMQTIHFPGCWKMNLQLSQLSSRVTRFCAWITIARVPEEFRGGALAKAFTDNPRTSRGVKCMNNNFSKFFASVHCHQPLTSAFWYIFQRTTNVRICYLDVGNIRVRPDTSKKMSYDWGRSLNTWPSHVSPSWDFGLLCHNPFKINERKQCFIWNFTKSQIWKALHERVPFSFLGLLLIKILQGSQLATSFWRKQEDIDLDIDENKNIKIQTSLPEK